MASLTSLLSQTLSEIRLIKAYGSEDVEFYKGENNFKNLFKYGMKTAKIESILTPLILCFAMLIFIFVISFGAYRVSVGAVSSGDLIAFLLYLFHYGIDRECGKRLKKDVYPMTWLLAMFSFLLCYRKSELFRSF